MTRSIISILGFGTLFVMQLGGDCASDGGVSYSQEERVVHEPERVYVEPRRETVYVEPPRRETVYVEPPPERVYVQPGPPRHETVYVEPDHHHDNYYDHSHHDYLPPEIPRGSYRVEDKDGKIRWKADDDGTFYVYDVSKETVRFSGNVRRGQEIIVQPGDDKVYVAGNIVSSNNLRRDARHQVYFAPGKYNATRTNEDRGGGNKTGGAGDPGRTMPKDVYRIASGKGNLAIDAAKQHGKVFVYDEISRSVLYTVDIDRGNSFKIDVNKGIAYVNSKRVANVSVPKNHQLSLYIDYK